MGGGAGWGRVGRETAEAPTAPTDHDCIGGCWAIQNTCDIQSFRTDTGPSGHGSLCCYTGVDAKLCWGSSSALLSRLLVDAAHCGILVPAVAKVSPVPSVSPAGSAGGSWTWGGCHCTQPPQGAAARGLAAVGGSEQQRQREHSCRPHFRAAICAVNPAQGGGAVNNPSDRGPACEKSAACDLPLCSCSYLRGVSVSNAAANRG